MKTKLTCIRQVSFFNVPLTTFRVTLSSRLPVMDKRLIRCKLWEDCREVPGVHQDRRWTRLWELVIRTWDEEGGDWTVSSQWERVPFGAERKAVTWQENEKLLALLGEQQGSMNDWHEMWWDPIWSVMTSMTDRQEEMRQTMELTHLLLAPRDSWCEYGCGVLSVP
jgi:hypothetical protein